VNWPWLVAAAHLFGWVELWAEALRQGEEEAAARAVGASLEPSIARGPIRRSGMPGKAPGSPVERRSAGG
jgi:hypothetical protein